MLFGVLLPPDHGGPLPQVGLGRDETQAAADHLVQALLLQQQWNLVQRLGGGVLNDAVGLNVAEQGNLPAHVAADRGVAPADQNIGLDAQRQKLLYRVLSGLALQFAAAGDLNDERHVDKDHVALGLLRAHLADGLQEGLGLNIAHGAADFADDHVHVVARHRVHPALDFVGDVGDDLDGGSQIIAPPLPVENGPVNLSGGDGGISGEGLVHKPLVVAQIQVRFGPVVGDENLPMLIGAHGAGVHIDIGVELLIAHSQAPLLQKASQGRRADALAQARHHAAGHKYKFCRHNHPPYPLHFLRLTMLPA
ncbi:hypothetical protein SDC9_128315 [bioreactor metagenome]|uniref:Uncharacterized protein n=1 Tax=bioreactor metagenome TaxID=1076179 RepID=A0A645CWL6_9ZZZZ